MIWFALVCISFCRIFFLSFCVLTQQRRGPIWCIYISIYSHCKTKFMQTSELKLFSSTAVAVAQTSNTNFWNVAGVLTWNERIDIFVALLLMYAYYYVHRDNELWMRTLGMRVCVYVRNVLCMSSCSSLLMMIKTYSVIQKELRLYVCARAIAQIYLPRLSQF